MSLIPLALGLLIGAVFIVFYVIGNRREARLEAQNKAWQEQIKPKTPRPRQSLSQPPTRDEMIEEILLDWGLRGEDLGLGDIAYLNNNDAWSGLWAEQNQKEDKKREDWLKDASAEWLPVVEDVIIYPPDFPTLTARYKEEMEEYWPYTELKEETWLYQIDGMLSEWEKREPMRVRPLIELVHQKMSKYLST